MLGPSYDLMETRHNAAVIFHTQTLLPLISIAEKSFNQRYVAILYGINLGDQRA